MPRIVSLIASATEIVAALGYADQLVGRSHECDYPSSVRGLPVLTEPKFDVRGTSGEIDQHVKETLRDGVSVYRVDAERLRALRPDVIVTQAHCDVCAVSLRDVEKAVCDWSGTTPRIVSLNPNSLADIWADIEQVGAALGVPERARSVIRELQGRMTAIRERAARLSPRPTVGCIEWLDPLMAAGNWMPELVELAGGVNVFGAAGRHSPWLTWEQLCGRDPDILLLLPCGFDILHCRQDLPVLAGRAEWPNLRAVRQRRVFLLDGNHYFNRPGPRLVESLEILADLFYPDVFTFGHEGDGWQRP
jgi:iron complex transport system substrate-binding protein